MPCVRFLGLVLPSVIRVSIGITPHVKWSFPEIGLETEFTVKINNSVIEIECIVNRIDHNDLTHLYSRALDLARGSVDLIAFAGGLGLTTVLHTFIAADGAATSVVPMDERLASLCTSYQVNSDNQEARYEFEQVYGLVLSEPALFMALNDLILAITLPHHAPVNCGRVVEGIRKMMAPSSASREQAWSLLRQSLQVDRTYIELITSSSTAPRHGDRSYISGITTTEIVRRTWTIMNRFLEFRKRGNQVLPLSEFPSLVGDLSPQ